MAVGSGLSDQACQIRLATPKDLVPNPTASVSVTGLLISNLIHSYFVYKEAFCRPHTIIQINNPTLKFE